MDIVTESELATMVMMSGGSKVICNMVELIDKMPVLYTYTAGEYSFEFKIDSEPLFYENVGINNGTEPVLRNYNSYICFVCKKGSKIICASTTRFIQSVSRFYRRFNSDGGLLYATDLYDPKIENVTVTLNSGYVQYFLISAKFDQKTTDSDGSTGYISYAAGNYTVYARGSTSNGNQHFFSTLPEAEFAAEYCAACEALKNTVSENT